MSTTANEGRPLSTARMPGPELPLPQIGILAELSNYPCPAGKYEIVKGLRTLFAETTLYTAIPQMVDAGLLRSELIEGRRGSKPGYCCTAKGLEVLKSWAKSPPTSLLAPSPQMLLWISTVDVRRPDEVLQGIAALEDVLYEEELELKLSGSRTRRAKEWNTRAELEYELERAALEVSRQFLTFAQALFEERGAGMSKPSAAKRK
jgi:DNA-binding PadR family transcriptional regulator